MSVADATVSIAVPKENSKKKRVVEERGPLLITHKGVSGPGVLRLSSFAATHLAEMDYTTKLTINFLPEVARGEVEELLFAIKKGGSQRLVVNGSEELSAVPTRLWKKLVGLCEIDEGLRWSEVSDKKVRKLAAAVSSLEVEMVGKSTFKEEFTTAGGVCLREVDREYQSKKVENLYFVGEVLNIDAVTGGYNFMNCWSSGYLCAKALVGSQN